MTSTHWMTHPSKVFKASHLGIPGGHGTNRRWCPGARVPVPPVDGLNDVFGTETPAFDMVSRCSERYLWIHQVGLGSDLHFGLKIDLW